MHKKDEKERLKIKNKKVKNEDKKWEAFASHF